VSVRSQRELYEYQIGQERAELDRYPEEEAEELALIYTARGAPIAEARTIARAMIGNREEALKTLAREELGLNPDDLGSPWGAALSSFLAFSVGAIIPLIPFVLGAGASALLIACLMSAVSLFTLGAILSLFSGRSAFAGGARMLLIGAAAGAATYLIGRLLGVGLT
jgi:VIT1/CCC1 family predicted Fe2+/Mn2+ transporter